MAMTRDEALALLGQYVRNDRMINHCLASEAVMRARARRRGREGEK
jgi:predicted hydrolase (HD superfamily)